MFFHQRFIPGLAIASYIVGDTKSRRVAVIDPTRDIDEYIQIADREGLRITDIVETHVHADYVSGSAELKARLREKPVVHCSGCGGKQWVPPHADQVASDGHEIPLGSIRLKAMHTPGHTPEHLSWALFDDTRSRDTPWLLFTGDFLFVGDVGRPDLLGPEERKQLAHQLYQSVFERLQSLPDFTEIYPAHGAGSLCGKALGSRRSSSLGYERRFNRSLQATSEQQWTENLLRDMPLAPPYFKLMKQMNAAGPRILGHDLPGQRRFSAAELRERLGKGSLTVDVRPKEAFAAAHIPGSINIPLGHNLPTWAGWVLPYDRPLIIVPGAPSDMPEVITHFTRVGLDSIEGYLEDALDTWQSSGLELGQLQTITVQDLSRHIKGSGSLAPFVLDVRTDSEWNAGHIEGATHIHGGLLKERHPRIPRDRTIAVICGTGYRASIAASFLKSEGSENVANVLGGMTAWRAAGLPVTQAG